MVLVRRIMLAFLAAAVVWAGVVAAEPAHAHGLSDDHADAIHMLAIDADADHHAAAVHAHGHDHDHDDGIVPTYDGEGSDPAHEGSVFHVHAAFFVALAMDNPSFGHVRVEQSPAPAALVSPLHTRSVSPLDRPPRSIL